MSLVICPSTLVHNWAHEIMKFFDEKDLKGWIFDGFTQVHTKDVDIIITSYEKVRSQEDVFNASSDPYLFIILDEAHMIKNSDALTTLSVKSL